MNLPHRRECATGDHAQLRTDGERIVRRSAKSYSQTLKATSVVPECRGSSVLRYRELHPPVTVVIGSRRAALITEHVNPRFEHAERAETSAPVA